MIETTIKIMWSNYGNREKKFMEINCTIMILIKSSEYMTEKKKNRSFQKSDSLHYSLAQYICLITFIFDFVVVFYKTCLIHFSWWKIIPKSLRTIDQWHVCTSIGQSNDYLVYFSYFYRKEKKNFLDLSKMFFFTIFTEFWCFFQKRQI